MADNVYASGGVIRNPSDSEDIASPPSGVGGNGVGPQTSAAQAGLSPVPPHDPGPGSEIGESLRIGQLDASSNRVDDVFWSTRKFVIYESGGQLRYSLPSDYATAKALRRRIADLGGLRASIENLRSDRAISHVESKRAARELAWALAEAFEDDTSPASSKPREVLVRVDERLRSLVKSAHRKTYASANLFAFFAIEVLLILLAIAFSLPGTQSDLTAVVPRYAIYCAFGALGAFLSVIIGIRAIEVNLDLKLWEHAFSGATRILIGVIGALVISLALDSGFIDPTFGERSVETTVEASANGAVDVPQPSPNGGSEAPPSFAALQRTSAGGVDNLLAMYLIFAFIAGFSESLVPNLLRRGEQAVGGQPQAEPPDGPIVEQMSPTA